MTTDDITPIALESTDIFHDASNDEIVQKYTAITECSMFTFALLLIELWHVFFLVCSTLTFNQSEGIFPMMNFQSLTNR
jgi:hypothetical protein